MKDFKAIWDSAKQRVDDENAADNEAKKKESDKYNALGRSLAEVVLPFLGEAKRSYGQQVKIVYINNTIFGSTSHGMTPTISFYIEDLPTYMDGRVAKSPLYTIGYDQANRFQVLEGENNPRSINAMLGLNDGISLAAALPLLLEEAIYKYMSQDKPL